MIAPWNRKEVYMGFSVEKCSQVRGIMAAHGIKYTHRLVSHANATFFTSHRARSGTFGENRDYSTQYYVYVHKDDYSKAAAALGIRA